MDLIEFIHESNKAKTEEELLASFMKYTEAFGLNRFMMAGLSHGSTSNKEEKFGVLFNFPEGWLKHYIDSHSIDFDPVYNKCLVTKKPFFWEESYEKDVPSEALRVMETAKDFSLLGGIALPIHRPFGDVIGMSFASDITDNISRDNDVLSMINAASNQFLNAYDDIASKASAEENEKVKLTNREYEVLSWLAKGKTKSDIAEILKVSESSIKRHNENILIKLDANNTTLAVVKALRRGLISPF